MNQFIFTKKAEKRLRALPVSIQERIVKKLKDLKKNDDIFSLLRRLHHLDPATHRLRVGDYRVILEYKKQNKKGAVFWILDVGDRKDIYE